jgi:hypothetical protein
LEGRTKKLGTSLNNYIIEIVEKSRHLENANPRPDLSKENSELKEENRKLRDYLRIKELILEKYESDYIRSDTGLFLIQTCKDKGDLMKSL